MKDELTALPNIGDDTARQLRAVGVDTAEALRQMGAKEAWLRILAIDSSACINRMLGLEGAVRGIKKTLLPEDAKADLRAFVREAKDGSLI